MIKEKWDKSFIEMLDIFEERSHCVKKKVACILVKDNKILSVGVNGTIKGQPNCDDIFMCENNNTYSIQEYSNKIDKNYVEFYTYYQPYLKTYITKTNDENFETIYKNNEYVSIPNKKFDELLYKNFNYEVKNGHNKEFCLKEFPEVNIVNYFCNFNLTDDDVTSHHRWSEVNEIHAEMNAIKNISNIDDIKDCTCYCTYLPCFNCAKMLVLFGCKYIVYKNEYDRSDEVKEFLNNNLVSCRKV